ncbi:signal peptidase I [Prochlorococcus sp. MIT 1300]|uniref:signal peptidase I n=1 Tax=Prochlorococcus sp. MIT 1300 TaxID=3096218 RepID=UPI0039BF3D93
MSELNTDKNQVDKSHSSDLSSSSKESHPFWDFWGPVLFTCSLYLGIRYYVAEARYIPSGSMLPSLKVQDRLIVEKMTFKVRPPRRGEVVVFNSPYAFDPLLRPSKRPSSLKCALITFPFISLVPGLGNNACDAYIKRVVAIGGDSVSINSKGHIIVNDQLQKEPYVKSFCKLDGQGISPCPFLDVTVPEKHVLVLGDNRSNSWDSRFWPGSPFLPESEILGRAVWRFWPLNRIGAISKP